MTTLRSDAPTRPTCELNERGGSLVDYAAALQAEFFASTSPESRRAHGQVFTPQAVSTFMAGLLRPIPTSLRILDPGAGAGALTAAVCDEIRKLRSTRSVEFHLYETDESLGPFLQALTKQAERVLGAAGHSARFIIHQSDFLRANAHSAGSQRSLFSDPDIEPFDFVIMNPPYFKIAGDSEHAALLRDVIHGQPNIYALFLAVASSLLRPGGKLVAITPRSFCSGPYFREFRRWFFDRVGLSRVHLFDSRKDIFEDVLQESVITVSEKLGKRPATITLSASHTAASLNETRSIELDATRVLDDGHGHAVIRIPTTKTELQLMTFVESWSDTFAAVGLRISTGPVVSFRATSLLLTEPNGTPAVPLVLVHNVKRFVTEWPLPKNGKPTHLRHIDDALPLLLPSKPYVLLRRFSAKEEARRLTASCYVPKQFGCTLVGLENHLNYITHQTRDLAVAEARGIAALLNSSLMDRYFRLSSGNTQVNATDIRPMPFPSLEILATLGKGLKHPEDLTSVELEREVLSALGAPPQLTRALLKDLE